MKSSKRKKRINQIKIHPKTVNMQIVEIIPDNIIKITQAEAEVIIMEEILIVQMVITIEIAITIRISGNQMKVDKIQIMVRDKNLHQMPESTTAHLMVIKVNIRDKGTMNLEREITLTILPLE